MEAVELFFLELLMMQEAAIARVSDRTYDLFREGLYREDSSGSQEKLFSLSQEAASAVLFVNFKNFVSPLRGSRFGGSRRGSGSRRAWTTIRPAAGCWSR